MKVKAKQLPDKVRTEVLDTLYTTAGAVRGRDAMKLFLRDLLTSSERIMLGRRIMIARKLLAGNSHREIEADMEVGKDTIWRVQRWLDDQAKGYEHAVSKLEREMDARHFRKRKSKYPPIFAFLKW
ncbi:MAG: Trp family transcriptional regulator [Patescibacteria group bacterium]